MRARAQVQPKPTCKQRVGRPQPPLVLRHKGVEEGVVRQHLLVQGRRGQVKGKVKGHRARSTAGGVRVGGIGEGVVRQHLQARGVGLIPITVELNHEYEPFRYSSCTSEGAVAETVCV